MNALTYLGPLSNLNESIGLATAGTRVFLIAGIVHAIYTHKLSNFWPWLTLVLMAATLANGLNSSIWSPSELTVNLMFLVIALVLTAACVVLGKWAGHNYLNSRKLGYLLWGDLCVLLVFAYCKLSYFFLLFVSYDTFLFPVVEIGYELTGLLHFVWPVIVIASLVVHGIYRVRDRNKDLAKESAPDNQIH